ncbi:MAG: periplasmic protein TonB2 [SAR86 cluster bacterium SAR86B]|uniref:Protein TonB n=1 Tax=SAR86 cluster bacterium SAR86B TaxID=1123867 RepID=J4WW19_9GAMM|nr:MAG: periplasmic protein TonB2 [SAR86 cluster bacterium SAR86B]|tara:strand:- start:3057 stop:3683 length:627 start_codon:yes stop_codon:yes gene_type:complete
MTINKELLLTVTLSFVFTFSVFYLIQSLISRSADLDNDKDKINYIEFIRIKQNDNLEERTRTLPEKPPKPKRPPQPEVEIDETKPPPMQNIDIDIPDFALPTDFKGAFLGDVSNLGSGTSQLIPLVKIAPRCPPEAAINGIDGSVVLNLLVNEKGKVVNVKLVSAKPARIFNKEASRAVRRWQFKPKTIDGVAVSQTGQLTVEFVCNV